MRTKIEQAKKMGSDALEKLTPIATDAKNKIVAGVKVVQESPEAERLVSAVKGSSSAKELLGVLAFSGASAAISPIVTWAACTDDNGCSTSMAKTFVTTALVTGGALYGAKRYMPSLFAKKEVLDEQELTAPPSSPTSPKR